MSEQPVRLLLVEDNPGDAMLLIELLRDAMPDATAVHVEWLGTALDRMRVERFDVILLDLNLPDSTGMDTVIRAGAAARETAFVVLTGAADEAVGMEAVRQGAQDYLIKGQTDGRQIARAIRYAIERKRSQIELQRARDELELRVRERTAELEDSITALGEEIAERRSAEQSLRQSAEQFQAMAEALPQVFWMCAPDLSRTYYVNPAYERLWGRSCESLLRDSRSALEPVHPKDRPQLLEELARPTRSTAEPRPGCFVRVLARGQPERTVRVRAFPIHGERGQVHQVCVLAEDVTGQRTRLAAG